MDDIQDILAQVEKPSRYIGTEPNSIKKNDHRVKLNIALAFPDLYEIGNSHFGIQILYNILNKNENISAERVFTPARDCETVLRETKTPLMSLETKRPLSGFDIIGFSLLYELNYTNVLKMLELSNIAVRSANRNKNDPIIIAGGPCVCNPEPMADFFDAMVFGDGEYVLEIMCNKWIEWKESGAKDKNELLTKWSELEGVYIPGFFTPVYDENGFQHLKPDKNNTRGIKRTIIGDLNQSAFPEKPVVAYGKPVHDRLRLEISRGCSRGCRFCQAGMIYRPVRERTCDGLLKIFQESIENTGYEDLSLLSLSTGDYTCLLPLMESLMRRCTERQMALSLPSIRADTLTPAMMELIKKVRKTGFTIAPEAGSQRLRNVINKNITYNDVETTVKAAFELGWQVIKLYFMIGLPTETREDLDAIVNMVTRIKNVVKAKKRNGRINVSVTTFIPKAHTPFQWERLISVSEATVKIQYLKSKLRLPGINIKWQQPEMSYLEGVLSRGDRRLGNSIEKAMLMGACFDGWTDQFKPDLWRKAFLINQLDPDFFTTRKRDLAEPLPWSHMNPGVSTDFLKEQLKDAQYEKTIDDCRHGRCHQCGVCDFKTIQPATFSSFTQLDPTKPGEATNETAFTYQWVEITYAKTGDARFFGHLEMAALIIRSFRRNKANIKYSQGFHPMPRISFDNPIPLGMESEEERFSVLIAQNQNLNKLFEGLNSCLPEGLIITNWRIQPKRKRTEPDYETFTVDFRQNKIEDGAIETFNNSGQWPATLNKGRTHKQIDIKEHVLKIEPKENNKLLIKIKKTPGVTIRPAWVLQKLFNFNDNQIKRLCFRKKKHNNEI